MDGHAICSALAKNPLSKEVSQRLKCSIILV